MKVLSFPLQKAIAKVVPGQAVSYKRSGIALQSADSFSLRFKGDDVDAVNKKGEMLSWERQGFLLAGIFADESPHGVDDEDWVYKLARSKVLTALLPDFPGFFEEWLEDQAGAASEYTIPYLSACFALAQGDGPERLAAAVGMPKESSFEQVYDRVHRLTRFLIEVQRAKYGHRDVMDAAFERLTGVSRDAEFKARVEAHSGMGEAQAEEYRRIATEDLGARQDAVQDKMDGLTRELTAQGASNAESIAEKLEAATIYM